MKASLITLLLLTGATARAADSGLPPNWTTPMAPVELFDGVYWVGTEGLGAYLFTSDEGHVLLDVGMPQNAQDVMASIESLGFAVEDIRYLLNTQAHFDHSGGLVAVKTASGAQMLASDGDRYALEKGVYEGWESRHEFDFPPVAVDRVLEDGEVVRVGDVALTAVMTPGHSPGCTSWAFTARQGDDEYRALVFCSASVAANRLAPDPQYPGIVEDYRRTFERMGALPVDVWLAPHPEQFDFHDKLAARAAGDSTAFVDPGEKGRRMATFESDFEAALADARGPGD